MAQEDTVVERVGYAFCVWQLQQCDFQLMTLGCSKWLDKQLLHLLLVAQAATFADSLLFESSKEYLRCVSRSSKSWNRHKCKCIVLQCVPAVFINRNTLPYRIAICPGNLGQSLIKGSQTPVSCPGPSQVFLSWPLQLPGVPFADPHVLLLRQLRAGQTAASCTQQSVQIPRAS